MSDYAVQSFDDPDSDTRFPRGTLLASVPSEGECAVGGGREKKGGVLVISILRATSSVISLFRSNPRALSQPLSIVH